MATLRDKIEKAAMELADARRSLDVAERNFRSLMDQIPAVDTKPQISEKDKFAQEQLFARSEVRNHGKWGLTNADKVLAVISSIPNKSWTYDEMVMQLPSIKKSALRVIVYTLRKKGKVTSEQYGAIKAVT
jgi:hypothetical protein